MSNSDGINSLSAWLEVVIAGVSGGALAVATIVKLGFNFNSRLQRIENQDLEQIINGHISDDWHNNRAPTLHNQVYVELDKLKDTVNELRRDVAVLIDRDRTAQRLEKIIAALNQNALSPKGHGRSEDRS